MFQFELLPNWKDVAKKAWSMWGNYITMALAGLETVSVVFLNGEPSIGVTLAVFVVIMLSTGARLFSQAGLSKDAAPTSRITAENLAKLESLITESWELYDLLTKRDEKP